mmetsp:Transcript_202/g.733  ORF Transcript_202/g.733 Transcript_202/m.733 type:complete len:245 (+) Transcript_202:131-865(+)
MRAMTLFAASMVKSMSSLVCLRPVKPASYCEGARYTPSSSMPRCHLANLSVSDSVASAKLRTGPSQKNRPNMPRMEPPHTAWPLSLPACKIPAIKREVVSSMYSYAPSSARMFRVSIPATIARGFPESVPAWYMGPAGATISMISRRPPYAPTGSPPPMTLPIVVRSGVTPQYSCAHPLLILNPVMTSSNVKSAPSAVVISRRPSRKDLSGTMKPELPTTGSKMTPAISPLFSAKIRFTASRSL